MEDTDLKMLPVHVILGTSDCANKAANPKELELWVNQWQNILALGGPSCHQGQKQT